MRIIIGADGFEKKETIEFSNENLDNFNFVDLIVDGKEYTISVGDLVVVAEAFGLIRKLFKENEGEIQN